MLLCRARDMEHVAASGLDEQRLFGPKIIGDLARKGVGACGDIGDPDRRESALLEQKARRLREARGALPALCAGRADDVRGIARTIAWSEVFHVVPRRVFRWPVIGFICMLCKQICQIRRVENGCHVPYLTGVVQIWRTHEYQGSGIGGPKEVWRLARPGAQGAGTGYKIRQGDGVSGLCGTFPRTMGLLPPGRLDARP